MTIKDYEENTGIKIDEFKESVKEISKELGNLDYDVINGMAYSLELLDKDKLFFHDEIKSLYKLAEALERLEFNHEYIIKVIDDDLSKE